MGDMGETGEMGETTVVTTAGDRMIEGQPLDVAIEANLPLVKHIVFQVAVHFPRHVDREDLARAGALGLVEAAQRFDESRGVPFHRFAAQRIRGAILDAVRSADWAPRSVRNSARALERTSHALATDLGRAPTADELAEAMDITPAQLRRIQDRVYRSVVLALDHTVSDEDDEDLSLVDVLTGDDANDPCETLETRELRAFLRDAVKNLPERHRLVIIGYFLENKTSADLARFLGVTESRISQVRTEALAMLRDGINAQFTDELDLTDDSRSGRRRAAFVAAIAEGSDWRDRIGTPVAVG